MRDHVIVGGSFLRHVHIGQTNVALTEICNLDRIQLLSVDKTLTYERKTVSAMKTRSILLAHVNILNILSNRIAMVAVYE